MLRTRVVTAILMVAVGACLLFFLPAPLFAAVAALVLLGAGGREAGRLAGLARSTYWIVFAAALLAIAGLLYVIPGPDRFTLPLTITALVWLCLLGWLVQPAFGRGDTALKLAVLAVILLGAWMALSLLQAESPWLVVLAVVVVAAADIGAYFSGKAIGGPKLAPQISPGKTRAGAIGGLVAATGLTALAVVLLPVPSFSAGMAAVLGLVLAAVSIGGDLFISLLKRQQGLKDSSSLLPGHGGLLDRFDSLGAALPFFALAWLWLGQ